MLYAPVSCWDGGSGTWDVAASGLCPQCPVPPIAALCRPGAVLALPGVLGPGSLVEIGGVGPLWGPRGCAAGSRPGGLT